MKKSVGVTFSCKQDHAGGWSAGTFTVQHQYAVLCADQQLHAGDGRCVCQ